MAGEGQATAATLTGFACGKCRRFYGGDGAKAVAEYCCAVDVACETEGCTFRANKGWRFCTGCRWKLDYARWKTMEQVGAECGSSNPLTTLNGDDYWFDIDDLFTYCDIHECKPSDLLLVWCEPDNGPTFMFHEFVGDHTPEDFEVPSGTAEVEKVVNDFIAKHAPWSWRGSSKKRASDEMLAELDGELKS